MPKKKPKVLRLLIYLSKEEKTILKKSAALSLGKEENDLLHYLLEWIETSSNLQFSKEKALQAAYHNDTISLTSSTDQKLRKWMSTITQFTEQLIVNQLLKQEPATYNYLLSVALNKRQEQSLDIIQYNRTRQLLAQMPANLSVPAVILRRELVKMDYIGGGYRPLPATVSMLDKHLVYLERDFLLKRFFSHIDLLILQECFHDSIIKKATADWQYWEEIYIEKAKSWQLLNWLISLSEKLKKVTHKFEWAEYKADYEKFESELDVYERKQTFKLLISIGTQQLNYGHHEISIPILQCCKYAYSKGLLVSNNKIDEETFLNVSLIAAIAQDFDWLEIFMDTCKEYIFDQKAENVIHLARAIYLFYQASESDKSEIYTKAVRLLSKVNTINPQIGLRVKLLNIQLVYELYHTIDAPFFFYQLKQFNRYIRERDIFSDSVKEQYRTFYHLLNKIASLKENVLMKLADKEQLISEIQKAPYLLQQSWLLKKLEEIT